MTNALSLSIKAGSFSSLLGNGEWGSGNEQSSVELVHGHLCTPRTSPHAVGPSAKSRNWVTNLAQAEISVKSVHGYDPIVAFTEVPVVFNLVDTIQVHTDVTFCFG